MSLAALSEQELDVVRRSIEGALLHHGWDIETRFGVTEGEMRGILAKWPDVDDSVDSGPVCLAINNSLNDLLHGLGISDARAVELAGANRTEMRRVYDKWAIARGWTSTGVL
ncbi:hypothetical protein [Sinorhizobium saheli]|uniref:Uncharacterized protein n=1 Tax=Sinorhizobium saheli TaxID=36856 RepID=A0A178YGA8_SINSA|nr:hypothetical protein [Sinorhizobium saheli]MQW86847.1 hypothetical protein [Sinorhizobium saheli]OAP46539.1 hypothetical protein ATB98_14290 [Sinorhizobium saheli]